MPDRCLGTDTLCDFLEGRADPGVRRRVEDHASRCASCRELLSSLARSGTPPVAPAPAEPDVAAGLAPGTVVGRYVIEHEIGSGGMGVVYAARDPALGRLVAVKVLRGANHPSTEERVRREAQAMARLAHPNVVAVHDVGRFEDRIFVAMEYVAGATLAQWSATPRAPHEVLDAYYAAGRGLAAAHAAGIVHRDFKPENVFVGHDGRVRVGDFGVARTVAIGPGYVPVPSSGAAALPIVSDPPAKPDRLTAPGTLLGTPYYIAPELYDGADADARSDQFSFCAALFMALHGERPFAGDTFTALATNVRAGRIRRAKAPGVSRRIHAAIRRGLSADPAARFASLHDLLAELRPPPRRRLARGPVLAAGAALAVGVAAGLVVAWRGGSFTARAADDTEVATEWEKLAATRTASGDHPGAEDALRHALAIRERGLGPDDPSLARDLRDLARAVRRQGRGEAALALARRAVAVSERAGGPELAGLLVELGGALADLEHYSEADAALARAETRLAAAPGGDPVPAALASLARGDVLSRLARWPDAAALYARALPVLQAAPGTRDAAARAELGLARILVELGQPAHALPELERLAAQQDGLAPEVRFAVDFTLARALWDTGGDRTRARALATGAVGNLRALVAARPGDIAQIEGWLASHGG